MNEFTDYIEKHSNYDAFVKEIPEGNLFNVIVIPAVGEPDILKTIGSIWNCSMPKNPVEVIVVLNSSEVSNKEIIELNTENENEIRSWAESCNTSFLKVYCINIKGVPKKIAGAGYARKTGMDEAIRRFFQTGNSVGVISSLDADSTVSENYLIEIERLFIENPSANACSIYFEHPVDGSEFPEAVYETIVEYELHLRYYKQVLKYVGFPYYHHTVGSSFAVRALTYCKQGGMNKKQAGEDFYFLHKIMPLGNFYELNSACVYPSPRPSDRVPFGTGATIRQFAVESKTQFLTYNFDAFNPLKKLFADKYLFFKSNTDKIAEIISGLDIFLKHFLDKDNFKAIINEMNKNSSNINSFNKRFFVWFDAFRLIKYLNFVHGNHCKKKPVRDAIEQFYETIGIKQQMNSDLKELLLQFRSFEKESIELYIH